MPEHEIFAAKASTFKQQDAKTWLNIIKPLTQWSGAYFLGIVPCQLIWPDLCHEGLFIPIIHKQFEKSLFNDVM